MAFELTRRLMLNRTFISNECCKRFYARGSRFYPPPSRPSSATEDGGSGDQNRPGHRETARELLENAASFDEAIPARKPKTRMEDVWNSSPYPKGTFNKRSQANLAHRPSCDPKETSIILFPGQGTQFVGMGRELLQYPQVKDMYDLASSILGYNLLSICLEGPKETLNKTEYCQPAILVTSLAALEKLKQTTPNAIDSCVSTAGFSVGELAAVTFAGALSFEDAVRLVKVRAEAMQFASDMTPSGMMTVFYGPDSELSAACNLARKHCESLGLQLIDCRVANFLYPDCKVIAGNNEALNFIEEHAAKFKLKRLKRLPVSGAFHTKLMEPAVEVVAKALSKMKIKEPVIPVHSNVDAKRYSSPGQIAKLLARQIVRPVCWEQTMHALYERNPKESFPLTYECGPGSSLKAILKKVNMKAALQCTSIEV